MEKTNLKSITFSVSGMHCASCELLIEEKFKELPEIEAVDASAAKNQVTIYYKDKRPSLEILNKLLKEDNYCLGKECDTSVNENRLTALGIALAVFFGFLLLNRLGLSSLINVTASSSLPAFFFFGLLAGVSTCAALVGGIVLSMAQQWSGENKMQPHLLFNAGRLVSYTIVGGLLGIIGSKLQLSLTFSALLVIIVSIFMIFNGLKMLGLKALAGFQIALPKSITHKAADHKNFQGKYMPMVMGALTFLLPCGFTITTESLALLSGSGVQGALIMFAFALGTLPGLLIIGFSAAKMVSSTRSVLFTHVAGALVLLFAIFNINSQFNVLGLPSLSNVGFNANAAGQVASVTAQASPVSSDLPAVNSSKQVIKMQASSSGYSPNYFKVRVGVPVRWEITDVGTSGCTNAVLSRGLFDGQISLTPGETSVKEFTPTQTGRYKFSCWMGMITGVIEVVDKTSSAAPNSVVSMTEVPSGAKGCGCGGGI